MTSSQPPLDPRKHPWKRGDVCALGSTKIGLVLDYTPEYLEVRWGPDGPVERLTGGAAESVIRYAHADSISPDGKTTNLETLETIEALDVLEKAARERSKTIKSPAEDKEVTMLLNRAVQPECEFDRRHSARLAQLALRPDTVSWYWKLRERIHRIVHHH
jgi:hypothetical protein